MKSLSHYTRIAKKMVGDNKARNDMFAYVEEAEYGNYDLPDEMSALPWIHKVVSSDPHDAIRTGTRVLSSVQPRIKVHPLLGDPTNKKRADEIEQMLSWWYAGASKRGRATVTRDLVKSALRYDEICAQVVYLPHQEKVLKGMGGSDKRLKYAKRKGPFAIVVHNPKQVYSTFSTWGLESVLLVKHQPVHEVLAFWGSKVDKLKAYYESGADEFNYVTVYDYTTLDVRVVWCVPGSGSTFLIDDLERTGGGGIEIMMEENELYFIPWVVQVGGTNLEEKPEHARIPLLYSIYRTKQWETQNIVETLFISEAIALAAAPRSEKSGPNPDDGVRLDYGDPGGSVEVAPGHGYKPLAPPPIDQNLMVIADRTQGRIEKSTVAGVLQGGGGGTSGLAMNLQTQNALGSLKPYKETAEKALADIYTQMLWWIAAGDEPVPAYGTGDNAGVQLSIEPTEIAVDAIYIDVELTADAPTDRMQRINGAAIAVAQLGLSREKGLADIGVTRPSEVLRQATFEKLYDAQIQGELVKIQAAAEMQIQEMQMQMEQARQQAAQQQAQPQVQQFQGQGQGQAPLQAAPGVAPPGLEQLGGQGMNPAMGGNPAQMFAPEATREGQTGLDRSGAPIEELA